MNHEEIKKIAAASFPLVVETAMRSFKEGDISSTEKSLKVALDILTELAEEKPATSPVEANRKELVRLLEENDWNIARVARDMGVTRRTLYMRLAAFGITRKKVPRLAKPII